MKLYLAQHGEACGREVSTNRHLTEQGQKDIVQIAEFLKQAGVKVQSVIHSGRLRAKQTAELLANAIAPGVALEISGLINPNDSPKTFDWQSDSWSRDMLVVGHQPFMDKLVSHLLLQDETRLLVDFQPGTIVCLEHTDDARWNINWVIRPELLRKITFAESFKQTNKKPNWTMSSGTKHGKKRLENFFSHLFSTGNG